MPSLQRLLLVAGALAASGALLTASNPTPGSTPAPASTAVAIPVAVELQPLAAQVSRLVEALDYIGAPLAPADRQALDAAVREAEKLPAQDARGRETAHAGATAAMQKILDRYALFDVHINPESRVKVTAGAAKPELVQHGWRTFLVKVRNEAGVTAPLKVESPQGQRVWSRGPTGFSMSPRPQQSVTARDVADRWLDLSLFDKPPLTPTLSGLEVEYRIIQLYSRDTGKREATVAFNVGQGTQDIGFRNDVPVLFTCLPARDVTLRVTDERGKPAIASFVIKDARGNVYPSPAKRLAPDFNFHPQVYRADGETIKLTAGEYTMEVSRGPEYIPQKHTLRVTESAGSNGAAINAPAVRLERWIDLPRMGWYSGDHHVHAAGCLHYESPTEGVLPQDMIRHILGEGLNIGAVLTWGPAYYYQKQFFEGRDHKLSDRDHLMHYDVEVSGFPSSHAGHLVLLRLKDQDYPNAKVLEDWPTWNLPVLQWAKSQGAVVGYAHTGWGLELTSNSLDDLPNKEVPKYDGVGANEYIVDVTHDAVDFLSTVDTPSTWELNIWYHTLNAGFRTRISGETDFPCIYGDRVGLGRSYVQLGETLSYDKWAEGLRDGRAYSTDGKSHLIDFTVNDVKMGVNGSELRLDKASTVKVSVRAAARLENAAANPSFNGLKIGNKPYWDLERARIGDTREVPVEVVVNGRPAARRVIVADGTVRDLVFDVPIERSSWVAVRILPSSHTNPVFVVVGGKPIRPSRASVEWCLAGVDRCWQSKSPKISEKERAAAERAYEHARQVYRQRLAESDQD
jgi:hypothetical protein